MVMEVLKYNVPNNIKHQQIYCVTWSKFMLYSNLACVIYVIYLYG